MTLARSRREFWAGVAVLILLAALWMIFTDEHMSRQLDDVDLTWDETRQVDFAPGVGR